MSLLRFFYKSWTGDGEEEGSPILMLIHPEMAAAAHNPCESAAASRDLNLESRAILRFTAPRYGHSSYTEDLPHEERSVTVLSDAHLVVPFRSKTNTVSGGALTSILCISLDSCKAFWTIVLCAS
jgi:hypothetical protein